MEPLGTSISLGADEDDTLDLDFDTLEEEDEGDSDTLEGIDMDIE